ncbi:MAG TPA: TolC family protein, partial [Thermoanaerobaculia bacterium]|nr:TolC family protein [Thermoanaerobaculia bacterium]
AEKTHRWPAVSLDLLASELLTPVTFTFPRGAFGVYPATGPIPARDIDLRQGRTPSFFGYSTIAQPLTQLSRIHLGIRAAEAERDIVTERLRAARLAVADGVRRLYYGILDAQAGLESSRAALALYGELAREVSQRVEAEAALPGDRLEVETRLAQEEYERLRLSDALASRQEQLNELLGRDIRTPCEVSAVPEETPAERDLAASQEQALARRPDLREARLSVTRSDLDRRAKQAELTPDLSLVLTSLLPYSIDPLPSHIFSIGLELKWEPFDWGRKRHELLGKERVAEQARTAVAEAEAKALVEVGDRFRQLAEARALLGVAGKRRELARERLRVKSQQYHVQAALLADLLSQEDAVAQADLAWRQALLALYTARADFERALGEDGSP